MLWKIASIPFWASGSALIWLGVRGARLGRIEPEHREETFLINALVVGTLWYIAARMVTL